jgi:hypothetical protein
VVEAVVLPPMPVFLLHGFISAKRGRADTFLILGNLVTLIWMSVLSGYLVAAVDYQWMFAIEDLRAIGWAAPAHQRPQPANLGDILERVLDKEIVIPGDIRVNLLDVELLTIKLRLVIASLDTAS